jgi:glycosyltransferase involved in cell wall biosynthesis
MSPVWSVVIPTRNRADCLRKCLRALAAQDYPRERFEVIVVDDGGSPGIEIGADLRKELEIALVRQPRSGPAAARNRGASLARGQFLAFTDDDCEPVPDWLSELERVLRTNPKALAGGRVLNALGRNPYSTASQLLIDYLYAEYTRDGQPRFLTSNNLALARGAFLQLGGFDESFERAAAEDRAFSEHWRSNGGDLRYVKGPVVHHTHDLTLAGFLRQHFEYGRGARHFHQVCRRNGWGKITMEPLRFYLGLIAFPMTAGSMGRISAPWLSTLLLASQAATAAGYAYEAIRRKPRLAD